MYANKHTVHLILSLSYKLAVSIATKMSALSRFAKQSIKPEVIPLLVIVGGALTGAVYIGVHAAKAPDVAWFVHKATLTNAIVGDCNSLFLYT